LIGLVGLICLMWDPTTIERYGLPTMLELLGL